MKQRILIILLLSGIIFSSCQKSSVKPDVAQSTQVPTTPTIPNPPITTTGGLDTLNNVTGYFRLSLALDSINTDNILVSFKPAAKTKYVVNEDAPTFQGFGNVSLSSLSSDNVPLAINTLPLTLKGLTIGLKVEAKSDGVYKLSLQTVKSIPQIYDVWLMDKYRKDSLDVRHNKSGYAFNIYKSDTTSFGANRFKLVIRPR